VRCVECADRARIATTAYRETDKGRAANMSLLRRRYKARREAGLCVWCARPAIPGRAMCEPHRAQHAANRQTYLDRKEQRV
jgi:hypothetical protein